MLRKWLQSIIILLIQFIEWLEYRNIDLDENDISKKILNSVDISNLNLSINTDTGFKPISHIHLTQPYTIWRIEVESGLFLEAADNHIVFNKSLDEIFIKDLSLGDSIKTIHGLEKITKIKKYRSKVSMFDVTVNDDNHRFYSNGILSHNTITTSIFLVWYILFNTDKNCLILANKGETTAELLDKCKVILKGLPFFMKPGMLVNNVMSMKFDNGCRLFGQTTTKSPAIGFTIHFLYMDEFAHIHANFLEPFYRSVYPTISSSKISRIAISSTPNGMNKFYQIYVSALEGNNDFFPIRVDWWQVPGRDESWKNKEIANLGSEEMFNQEYGNQFIASSSKLLDGRTLKFLKKSAIEYKWVELYPFDDKNIKYDELKWHPRFDPSDIRDTEGKTQFLISIDTAGGVGKDFSVLNIFKIIPSPKKIIENIKEYQDESSFFSLLQIGLYRNNLVSIENLNDVLSVLMYEIFSPEQVKILLELDYKGYLLLEKMENHYEYFEELMVHTKHTKNAKRLLPGLKQSDENKMMNCLTFRKNSAVGKVILTEEKTYNEVYSFGLNNRGKYESQIGNDDIAITCVNTSAYFGSSEFNSQIEMIYDHLDESYKSIIDKKMEEIDGKDNENIDLIRDIM